MGELNSRLYLLLKYLIGDKMGKSLKEERLFLYLVNTFKTSAMVALGKIENPMTNKLHINLKQASYYAFRYVAIKGKGQHVAI